MNTPPYTNQSARLQEDTKDEIRKRKKSTKKDSAAAEPAREPEAASKPKKKRVSFG